MKNTKQMTRRFNHLLKTIEHAERGQAFIRPTADGYSDRQREQYAGYQAMIDRANAEITELKKTAAEMVAAGVPE